MIHGKFKKLGKIKTLFSGSSRIGSRYYCLLPLLWVTGCTSLKKAALIGGATSVAAGAASALSGGALVPAVAGGLTASVTSVVVGQSTPSLKGQGMTNCVEPNFFSVVQQLVESGGWLLTLVILVPMVLGWILPGPLERRKKK
tara:strand:- start:126 stop:554 length:429 start_codon:yes stop_codon:yes gene_type:complete